MRSDHSNLFFRAGVVVALCYWLSSGTVFSQEKLASPQVPERVVLFETKATHPLLSQGYRIEIFDNGDVVYTGVQNVARMGEHRLNISRRSLGTLLARLWNIQTTKKVVMDVEIPPQPACPADLTCDRTPRPFKENWKVEIVGFDGRKTYEQRVIDSLYHALFWQALERTIHLRSLRCPFYLAQDIPLVPFGLIPKGTELCERGSLSEQRILEIEKADQQRILEIENANK